jgi:hypothetical protein
VLSARAQLVDTKTGPKNLTSSVNALGFQATNCTGAVFNTFNGIATGTVVINGTKAVNGQTVYRFDTASVSTTASLNGNFKDIALITATTFTFGNGASDADGYPTLIDTANTFTKQ